MNTLIKEVVRMIQHIRVFNNDQDFVIAKEILSQKGVSFSETPKPKRIPGNSSRGIVYEVSEGVRIQDILARNGIETKCFRVNAFI